MEFFGTSATNYIMGWFISLDPSARDSLPLTRFISHLCAAVHSMDAAMMLQTEPQMSIDAEDDVSLEHCSSGIRSLVTGSSRLIFDEHSSLEMQLAAARVIKK